MLVQFRVENFRSIRDEQVLSFVASKDKERPENLIECNNEKLLKAAAIYGPNGSGKSNAIKALRLVRHFVTTSATKMNLGDNIKGITPFRLDTKTVNKPSSFEVTLIVNDTRYTYGFTASNVRVYEEWLHAYPSPHYRRQVWFERSYDPKKDETMWVFRGPLKSNQQILKKNTRDNGLVLSRGAELNIESLEPLYLWFRKQLWIFDLSNPPIGLMHETATRILKDENLKNRISSILEDADLGIEGISVNERVASLKEVPDEIKHLLTKEGLNALGSTPEISINTIHRVINSKEMTEFNFEEDESNGTKRIFALAGPLLDALDKGAIVVVDELECSMHPSLTRKLLELFQSQETNKNGAQILFATHDVTLMNSELFRRDQIWLTEKNDMNATELYSLYDFKDKPRKTESFQKNYLAGRYGGTPKFGPIFEDLEIK